MGSRQPWDDQLLAPPRFRVRSKARLRGSDGLPGRARGSNISGALERLPPHAWMAKYLRGVFEGNTNDLAAPDQEYPLFRWSSRLKEFKRTGKTFEITPEETMTARFSDDVRFHQRSFEMWGSPTGVSEAPESSGETASSEESDTGVP